jgi:hypothetical protein
MHTLALLLHLASHQVPDAGPSNRSVRSGVLPFRLPAIEAAVDIGRTTHVNGFPLRLGAYRTALSTDEVMSHFIKAFAEAGFFLPPRAKIPGLTLPHVSALDPSRRVAYLVYGWPEPNRQSTFIIGAAGLQRTRPPEPENASLVPPKASQVTQFDFESTHAVGFRTVLSQSELMQHYRSKLPSAGWTEPTSGVFQRKGRRLRILAKDEGNERSVVVWNEGIGIDGVSSTPDSGSP